MKILKATVFLVFLVTASWQDLRRKSVSIITFWLFGVLLSGLWMGGMILDLMGWSGRFMAGRGALLVKHVAAAAGGAAVGGGLFVINKLTEGAVGEGDGLFFILSGISLGFYKNLLLLFGGLLCCNIWCMILVVLGAASGKDVRKREVAFLPFLLPAGIWVVFT